MRSGRSRPRPDRPSSNGSIRDGLYDNLLASLAEGGEPLASREEFGAFVAVWRDAHPGARFPILDGAWPRPVQRRRALDLLYTFTWPAWLSLERGMHEVLDADPDPDATGEAPTAMVDEAALRTEWEAWRDGLVRQYRLAGLVADAGPEATP